MKFARTLIALAAMSPMLALATGPGQYEVAGIQQICLTSSNTWYGVTFSGWGGAWQDVPFGSSYNTHIYGNYSAGAGNDSMVFKKGKKGTWTEWRDDLSFQTVIAPATLTFVKTNCDPPAAEGRGKADPAK
jgi:hypothetical protein